MSGRSDFDFDAGIDKELVGPDMGVVTDVSLPGVGSAASEDASTFWVALDQVQVFEKNPRLVDNEKFDDIMSTVRARGLDQIIVITRRPGEAHYILQAGGKTRYRVLEALLAETGDTEKYGGFLASYVPFQSNLQTMLAHGTENLTRGDMTFYELARYERDVFEMIIESDPEFANASLRDRAQRYTEIGLDFKFNVLSVHDYALDVLFPHFDQSLKEGRLSNRDVQRIRKEESEIKAWLDKRRQTDLFSRMRDILGEVLESLNTPHTKAQTLIGALRNRVAEELGIDPVSVGVDKSLSRLKKKTKPQRSPASNLSGSDAPHSDHDERAAHDPDGLGADPFSSALKEPVTDVATIRSEATELARTLAASYGFGEDTGVFFLTPDNALGFGLSSPDSVSLAEREDRVEAIFVHQQLHMTFWGLIEAERAAGRLNEETYEQYVHSASSGQVLDSHTYRAVDRTALHIAGIQLAGEAARSPSGQAASALRGLDRLSTLCALYLSH